ncbi:MAG TPA: V-type ATP synthase subunit I [Candidatus Limiplasma sp.]|nr:V-type ATP synthase subunit I [Candidatus Limiplasma sp.]
MAIVEMKHMDMLALEHDRLALLRAIQKLRCVQVLPADAEHATFNRLPATDELPQAEETIARVDWAISRLQKYDTAKKPLMADKPTITDEQANAVAMRTPELMKTVERLEALEREAGELRGQSARVDSAKEQLMPWKALSLPPAEIRNTKNTIAMLGSLQKSMLDRWTAEGTLTDLCWMETVSVQRDLAYVCLMMHRSNRETVMNTLKEASFTQIQLQTGISTVEEQLTRLAAEKDQLETSQQAIVAETASMAPAISDLKELYDVLGAQRARMVAARSFSASESTFFLQSWIPAPLEDAARQKLQAVSPSVALEFYGPLEGEEPPVILQNQPMISPFETVVSSFSLPAPFSVDPTAVMMPFFINFMGMMVSDAGYGLAMAIIAPLLIRILKPAPSMRRMLWIILGGGIMTVFWGAMYNSWFGYAPFPSLLDPMNNALPVMGLCIGLGALHLFAGLGMAAYLNIKRGHPLDAVADQLSWFLLIIGLALMAVVPSVGKWLAIAGAAIIVVFAGRAKSNNPLKRLLSGLGALYGVTSWVSDLLSYIRLFGMGLATGVIGMVINILVGMVAGFGPVGVVMGALVFVGGHLFNAGINIFGAYVHSCRLQYIEFFGKFYEDGGKPFLPLTDTGRYVYIRDAQTRA